MFGAMKTEKSKVLRLECSRKIRVQELVQRRSQAGVRPGMTAIRSRFLALCLRHAIALAFVLGLAGCVTGAHAPAQETFPVHCTMEAGWPANVTLEQLKDLPVPELNHPEIGVDGVALKKAGSTNYVTARTWRQFARYTELGFEPADNADLQLSGWFIKTRGFIPFLEQAQPASKSFVRDLKLNRDLLSILPIDLGPQVSQEEIEAAQQAIHAGKSWRDFYPDTKIRKHTRTMIQLEMNEWLIYLRVVAYGDFDHDGCEDVLICVTHESIQGTWLTTFPVILTRRESGSMLQEIRL